MKTLLAPKELRVKLLKCKTAESLHILALKAMMDASECVDGYSGAHNQIVGFLQVDLVANFTAIFLSETL